MTQTLIFLLFIGFFLPCYSLEICKLTMINYLKELLAVPGDYDSFCHRLGDVFDESCYCLYQNRMHPSVNMMENYFARLKKQGSSLKHTFDTYEKNVIFNYAFNVAPEMEKRLISSEPKELLPSDRVEIPRIIHKFWISNPKNPHPVPDLYADIIKNDSINLSDQWKIIIWVWDESLLKESLEKIKASAVNAKVESMSLIHEPSVKKKVKELLTLMNESKYSTVITKVKYDILDLFGGAYCDMDVRILRNLDPLLANTQSFLFLTKGIFYHLADCFFMQTVKFMKMNRTGSTEKLLTFLDEWGKTDWFTYQLYSYPVSATYIEHLEVRGWKRGLYGDYKIKSFAKRDLSVNTDKLANPQSRLPYKGIIYQN